MDMILSLQKLSFEAAESAAGSGLSMRCSTTSNNQCTNNDEEVQ
jgi:hypothetical protein